MTLISRALTHTNMLFDKAMTTQSRKDIANYIKNITLSKNKPHSFLGMLGLKKSIEYDPISLAKLSDLRDHLKLNFDHQDKKLNAVIDKLMSQAPLHLVQNRFGPFYDAPLPRAVSQQATSAEKPPAVRTPEPEVIFINTNSKLEQRYRFLANTRKYQSLTTPEQRCKLMSANNVIIHHDKNAVIVEPKINLFTHTTLRTDQNTHHYKTLVENALEFSKACKLNIDDTLDQMYRALKHAHVNTDNVVIDFKVKDIVREASLRHPPGLQYDPVESFFEITLKAPLMKDPEPLARPVFHRNVNSPLHGYRAERDDTSDSDSEMQDAYLKSERDFGQFTVVKRFAYV
ncbi:hypothetical protein [Rouxiella chamberiensis]|uniref:hypothetical protein n=1 Tax=Rouxiella chamberiensis TaxID=1513468 RepID=UPI0005D46012|nr:hypothetical protein [Rouxiella chamberiensis]